MRIKQVRFNEVVHNTTTKLSNHSRNEYFGGLATIAEMSTLAAWQP